MTVRHLLLEPRDLWWEANGISDPAVAEFSDRKYMLYRATGLDRLARIGVAISEDGEHFERFDTPILEGDERSVVERLGLTTPRLTKIDRDYLLTYAALSVYSAKQSKQPVDVPWRNRVSIIKTRNFQQFERLGPVVAELDTHDPVLFPVKIQNNYWLMHRLDKGIHVSVSPNIRSWGGGYQLLEPEESWEAGAIAAACPPLAIERGWLFFYNAIDAKDMRRIGAVLLDRQNPAFVIARTKEPLLEASEPWEKRGQTERGVTLAAVLLHGQELSLYYGAGTKVIGLAKLSLDAVLQSLGLPASP